MYLFHTKSYNVFHHYKICWVIEQSDLIGIEDNTRIELAEGIAGRRFAAGNLRKGLVTAIKRESLKFKGRLVWQKTYKHQFGDKKYPLYNKINSFYQDRSFVRITFFRNSFFPSNFVLSKIWLGQVRLGGLGNVRGWKNGLRGG